MMVCNVDLTSYDVSRCDPSFRQFFPKKMRFESISDHDVEQAMHSLNHRPRKCLDFKTPHEVFMKQLQSYQHGVALQN